MSKVFNRNWLSAHYLTVPAEQDITLDNGELLQVDELAAQLENYDTEIRHHPEFVTYKQFIPREEAGRKE